MIRPAGRRYNALAGRLAREGTILLACVTFRESAATIRIDADEAD
jgi:hypothetical protein